MFQFHVANAVPICHQNMSRTERYDSSLSLSAEDSLTSTTYLSFQKANQVRMETHNRQVISFFLCCLLRHSHEIPSHRPFSRQPTHPLSPAIPTTRRRRSLHQPRRSSLFIRKRTDSSSTWLRERPPDRGDATYAWALGAQIPSSSRGP